MFPLRQYDFKAHTHLYTFKDLRILLDVNSGAVHIVDEVAFDLIQALRARRGDLEDARQSIASLHAPDQIHRADQEIRAAIHEQTLFTPETEYQFDFSRLPLKALCINIAHACNMRCRYCFAGQGNFGQETALMSAGTGRKAIDYLLCHSEGASRLEVDFFGGEPLLNVPVLKELVDYAGARAGETGQTVNFTLTTNAVLLDDSIMDFIIDRDISIILSLDGRPEVNDLYRQFPEGRGSYDHIVPRIAAMVARKPVSYYVRGTFSRSNLDFSRDFDHLARLGFDAISLEPATGTDPDFAIQEEDVPRVLSEYEKLTQLLLEYEQGGRKIDFFHFNLDLQRGPCLAKITSGCGAGLEYLAVTPGGDLYPCHQFIGQKDFYMGNVHREQPVGAAVRQQFLHSQLQNKDCRQCWARFYCGGGCLAQAHKLNQSMRQPVHSTCAMHKKRIECAIYLNIRKQVSSFLSNNEQKNTN